MREQDQTSTPDPEPIEVDAEHVGDARPDAADGEAQAAPVNGAGHALSAEAAPEIVTSADDAEAPSPSEDSEGDEASDEDEAAEDDEVEAWPEEDASDQLSPSEVIARRPSTTAVHRAAAAFLKHKLPPRGAMAERLSWFITTLFGWVFTRVDFSERNRQRVLEAANEGQIVYVYNSRSTLDYLYYNWSFIQYKLPLARFANDISAMWLHPVRVFLRHLLHRRSRRQQNYQLAAFDYHFGNSDPLWVFLSRPRRDEDDSLQYSQAYLVRLMELHKNADKPVFIVPTLLAWDKRPDSSRPTLVDEFFGTSTAPGAFRKGLQFLNMAWQTFFVFGAPVVSVGQPIRLDQFREEYPEADMAEAAELLRQRLVEELAQERQVIMGPPLKQTRTLKAEVLRKPELVDAIARASAETNIPEPELRARARAQLDEIAADFTLLGVKTLGAILSPIFYLIYRGFHVDEDGLQRLREVARDSRVILVPSHKSYIDFLVLSYVFYKSGLIPPHIAAGINMAFWPLGALFRRCGAFFLRRTFKGDPIYSSVFKQYVVKLLEEGHMIEFFPEGTRSRTGKLLKPRYGMVRMIIDAFVAGRFEKLVFQPISIGYEKIIEGSSYRREALGAEKEQESAAALLKASSVLTSNYGRVYIEFAEPISLTAYMARYEIPRDDPSDEQLQRLTVRLAHRVLYDVAEVTPVTPSALAAIILMTAPGRGIGAERMLVESGFLLQLLLSPDFNARLTTPLNEALNREVDPDWLRGLREGSIQPAADEKTRREEQLTLGRAIHPVLHQALQLLKQNNLVEIRTLHDELFYTLTDKQRIDLNYYKNNIIHFFVAAGLLAASLVREGGPGAATIAEAQERSLFLSRLFKHEFYYKERTVHAAERTQFEAAFGVALGLFERRGWVTRDPEDNDRLTFGEPPAAGLEYMRTLMLPYLEPYLFVCKRLHLIAATEPTVGLEQKDFIRELLKNADLALIQAEANYNEALSKPALENVLTLLLDLGVLVARRQEGRRGRSITFLTMPPDWRANDRYTELATQLEPFTGRNRRRLDRFL